jgi:hypothetical protein
MGPCPLPDLKRMKIHDAMDEFQASASSIRLNKENNTAVIRWGNEYQVKDRSSAVRMAQRKMKALEKWSEAKFEMPYRDWATIDGIDNNRIIVKFRMPEKLFDSYVLRYARAGDPYALELVAKNPYKYNLKGSKPKEDPPTMAQLNNSGKEELHQITEALERFFKKNGIRVEEKKESYAMDYKAKTGKSLTAVALADIADNLITVSRGQQDGTSLLEEAMHFAVWYLWDSGELDGLKLHKDPNGIPWFKTTPQWRDNHKAYEEVYRDAQGREDWETLVAQEVITKIITDYIYNEVSLGNLKPQGPISRIVSRIWNFIKNLFSKKNTDGSYQFNFPKEIEENLGKVASDFINDNMDLNTYKLNTTEAEKNNPFINSIDQAITPLADTTNKILNALKQRKLRLAQKTNNLYNSQIKANHERLLKHYNYPTIELLEANLKVLQDAQEQGTLNDTQKKVLEQLTYIQSLFPRRKEDQEIAEEIRTLNLQIEAIDKQIKEKEFQKAIKILIHGLKELQPDGTYTTKASLYDEITRITEQLNTLTREIVHEKSAAHIYPLLIKAKDMILEFDPIMKALNKLISPNNKDITEAILFDSMSEGEILNLKEGIRDTNRVLAELKVQLEDSWDNAGMKEIAKLANLDADGNPIFDDLNPEDLMNSEQMDIYAITAQAGSKVDMNIWQIQSLIKTNATLANRVRMRVQEKTLALYKLAQDNKDYLMKNKVIQEHLKRTGFNSPEQLVYETLNNRVTGYSLGEFNMAKWKKAQDTRAEEIYDELEKFMLSNYNVSVKIPRGKSALETKARFDFIKEDTAYFLTEQEKLANINPIVNLHNELWSKWYKANSTPVPNWEAVVEQKRKELGAIAFDEWAAENLYIWNKDGRYKEYPVGVLSVPNDTYKDENYAELMQIPEFVDIHNKYTSLKEEADDRYPPYITSTTEWRRRVPQLSADAYSTFYRTSLLWKGKGPLASKLREVASLYLDGITDAFASKKDDDIKARVLTSQDKEINPIYTPPIRFTEKLDNPQLINRDVIGNLAAYMENAENYFEVSYSLPYFEAIRESAKRSTFVKTRGLDSNDKEFFSGDKTNQTNAIKVIEDMFLHDFYGQNIKSIPVGKLDLAKLIKFAYNHIRDIYLGQNFSAVVTGFNSAMKELVTESLTGRVINKESAAFALGEYTKNLPRISKDWKKPIKTTKHTALMQRTNLLEDNREMFKDTDKLLILNRMASALDYALWQAADHGVMMNLMIAVMDNYRFINGKWYDKVKYLNSNREHTNETWESHRPNSFWNKVEFVNGKLKPSKDIGQSQWDFVILRAKLTGRDIRMQKSDLDDSILDHQAYGPIFTMMRSFISIGLAKRLKPTHRNFLTQKPETGIWNYGLDLFTKDKTDAQQLARTRTFLTNHNFENLQPEQQESLRRVRMKLVMMNISWLIMVVAHNLVDDDDDAVFQLLKYISTRTYLEETTFSGPGELTAMILKPIAGQNYIEDLWKFMPENLSEEKVKVNDIYTSRGEVALSLLLKGYKGIAETSPLPIPGIGNPKVSQKKKDSFISNKKILGPNLLVPPSWFFDEEGDKLKDK